MLNERDLADDLPGAVEFLDSRIDSIGRDLTDLNDFAAAGLIDARHALAVAGATSEHRVRELDEQLTEATERLSAEIAAHARTSAFLAEAVDRIETAVGRVEVIAAGALDLEAQRLIADWEKMPDDERLQRNVLAAHDVVRLNPRGRALLTLLSPERQREVIASALRLTAAFPDPGAQP